MTKKKTKVKVELTRGDFLLVAGASIASAFAAQFVTTGPLSPFARLKQGQLEGVPETGHERGLERFACNLRRPNCF